MKATDPNRGWFKTIATAASVMLAMPIALGCIKAGVAIANSPGQLATQEERLNDHEVRLAVQEAWQKEVSASLHRIEDRMGITLKTNSP